MLSLKNRNKNKYKETRKEIIKQFDENMLKYSGYTAVVGFSRKTFDSLIKAAVARVNITNADIETACNGKENEEEKKEIEAFLLSFLYVFVNPVNVRLLGPGDIAAEDYFHLDDDL